MNNLVFSGLLSKRTEVEQINDSLKKQQILLEIERTSPSGDKTWKESACFDLLNDKIDLLSDFKEGDSITVFFNMRANEYQGKLYGSNIAWKIEKSTE